MSEKPRVKLIAEVASNAGSSLDIAAKFIERFATAGADIIKFQLTRVRHLAKTDPQYDWFARTEWSPEQVDTIDRLCFVIGVDSLWTVYHPDDIDDLPHASAVKVGAGEAHSGRLAEAILTDGRFQTIYVSEGIRPAHASYRADGRVKILGTCSRYPAPHGLVAERFNAACYDGWSDHSVGLDESVLAVIKGATVIERHVQIREQAREPRCFELTVEEFAELRRRVDEDPDRYIGRWNHKAAVLS